MIPRKLIFIDTEGTGLINQFGEKVNRKLEETHDIINLAGLIVIDGKVKAKFDYKCQPVHWKNIDPEALEINGVTEEELKTRPKPESVYEDFIALMGKYVQKFNKKDKFTMAGWNVTYDLGMLLCFFNKMGDKYLGSWINMRKGVDYWQVAKYLDSKGCFDLPDYKLGTVCDHFGIKIKGQHSALPDIIATYKVGKKLDDIYNTGLPL